MGTVRIGGIVKSSPSTQFWLEADWVQQSDNASLLRVWLRAANGPSGNSTSQFNNYGIQEAHADHKGRVGYHDGNPFLPSGYAQNQTRWHDHVADVWYEHDANGFLYNVGLSMHLQYGNVNEWHGGSIGAPPRIPKPPTAPGAPVVSNLKPTSATLSWAPSGDNRGAAIDQYLLRVSKVNPADTPGQYTDYPVSASTLSQVVTGLTPGTQYYAVVYARNSAGYSPKSGQLSFKTPSGFYVFNGTEWRPTEVFVFDGAVWRAAEVQVFDGSTWKAAG